MAIRASEKIIEALSLLLEGYAELQESVETDFDENFDDEEDPEKSAGLLPETALSREMKVAVEATLENNDFTPEEVAHLIASLTEALEEIDPNVFNNEEIDVDDEEDDDYEDEDDDDDDAIELGDDDYEEDER